MCELYCAPIIVNSSQGIAARPERDDFGSRGNQSLKIIPIELSRFGIHLCDVEPNPALNFKRLPRRNVRMMLEFSNHNLIARPQRASERARQVIDHRSRIRGENN